MPVPTNEYRLVRKQRDVLGRAITRALRNQDIESLRRAYDRVFPKPVFSAAQLMILKAWKRPRRSATNPTAKR
jgi:hypothetical protein